MSAPARLRAAIAAAVILAIGMGFGRFAFTAIYPHMVKEGVLSLRDGSLAASANYAGYLLGAILAMRARAHSAHRLSLWSVAGTALCLGVLALPMPVWLFVTVRGVAGVFSALAMVAASLWLLEQRRHARGAPLLYAGVGAGIAVSAELLVLASQLGWHSAGMWLLLAGVTVLAGLAAAPAITASGEATPDAPAQPAASVLAPVAPWPLVLIYGLAGLGYIVTATYLPVLVKTALPGLNSAHVWAVFGLGAAPSCFLWYRLHERLGTRQALRLNLLLQALGVALPVLAPSAAGYLFSAILVGGTFVGTVTIAMPAAQRAAVKAGKFGSNMMAIMTVVYGIGQIIGPVLAGSLYAQSHSFNSALLAAAGALLLAIVVSLRL
ncbi:YbfB/YjiJ family MFS transporter [Janthinobacterium sp. SUN128]|uniref:YbfB/YjiJ family MFS transporter n=1 Tax=Janthinobacterium lividum TaxID=29581 RepID=A0AAJ4MX76_9BURK|nr:MULTISPECIES: YbfB/YjiJ family MFS transporter [Janthinobacterium]KAB0324834.1 YbfB/YjiJ family MFS transporter [Janthinobacterium lividum]MDO8032870.1 YbfB/YjiJ family MFS transporter [Janthinobacterium sp. SUN128]QSX98940.1 YbfB/YjiJ family MFS transporter [Janthinobacterium lividum]UGQ38952.1 YbfB/YjiJ family MFS transporter [Janthinobacterium sp. PLB04]